MHKNVRCGLGRNKDVGMGKYERVGAGTVSIKMYVVVLEETKM